MSVVVVTTGGTIAMRRSEDAGGFVPSLGGNELGRALHAQLPAHRVEEFCNLPSSHIGLDMMWALRDRVATLVATAGVRGVVVTHGTDTLEETAMLLDLTVPGLKPVVVTGSMRAAGELGWDGAANLAAAVRTAAHPRAEGLGCLVVMNDEIHAARAVVKTDTHSLDTFQSPLSGPLGRIVLDTVHINRRVERIMIATGRLEPGIPLIKLGAGMTGELIDHVTDRGVRGMVIEAFGGGRIPPAVLPSVARARSRGITVVVTTRCPSGRLGDHYGYEGAFHTVQRLGVLFAPGLNGQKARIQLAVVLGAAENEEEVRRAWSGIESEFSHFEMPLEHRDVVE